MWRGIIITAPSCNAIVSGIAAAGRRAVAARLLLIAAGAAGVTAVAASGTVARTGSVTSGTVSSCSGAVTRQLPGDIYELVDGRPDEVSEQGPDGPSRHPAEKTDYPLC